MIEEWKTYWTGTGWDKIWQEFLKKLESFNDNVDIADTKEKFGVLRTYLVNATEEEQKLADELETASRSICIECGSPAEYVSTGSWIVYLCKDCADGAKRRNGIDFKKASQ